MFDAHYALAAALAALLASPAPAIVLADGLPATIQSALDDPDDCPDDGCELEIPCGRFEITGGTGSKIVIKDKTNLIIRGCGMNGTTVAWNADAYLASQTHLVDIQGPSAGKSTRWITFEDMKLEVNHTCVPDPPGEDCGDVGSYTAVRISGGVEDVQFNRVHFHATTQAGSANTSAPAALAVSAYPQVAAQRISASDCRIHSSGIALFVGHCNDCWFDGNWVGVSFPTGERAGSKLVEKGLGLGVRLVNNSFDLKGAVLGIHLRTINAPNATTNDTWRSTQIVGNTFLNSEDGQDAIQLVGYNAALIQGNSFFCPPEDDGCDTHAVNFSAITSNCNQLTEPCGAGSLVAGNMSDGYDDCIVRVATSTGGDNADNVIRGNLASMPSTGSGSFSCGAGVAENTFEDNVVIVAP